MIDPVLALNLLYQVAVLALVALGLAVVFGQLGVMNMAQGEFLTLGAYAMVWVQKLGLPLLWGVPAAVLVCAILGFVVERAVVRPFRTRPLDTLLATWGVSILLRKGIEAVFGRQYQSISYSMTGTAALFGVDYPLYRLVLMTVLLAGFAVLIVWYRRSLAAAKIRAMVANPTLAQAVGLPVDRLAAAAFIFGVSCTGLAGALLAPLVHIDPAMGLNYLLQSFFVLVVGGLGSLGGLFAGSAIVGSTQVVVANILGQTDGYMAVLILSIVFLWWRPGGLLSRN